MILATGDVLANRYRVVRVLKQELNSTLYRAWDLNLNVAVALRETFAASPQAQQQLADEIKPLAALSHPNLARITDYFAGPNYTQYVVLSFVESDDLEEVLAQRGSIPPQQAMQWLTEITEAVSYLHSRPVPIAHRNIQPSSIRITKDGHALLMSPLSLYATGLAASSPYAAPEPAMTADARADVYALGAMLYRVLTAQVAPVRQPNAPIDQLPMMYIANTTLDPNVGQVIVRAMAAQPDLRFANAAEFQAALKNALTPRQPTVRVVSPTGTTVLPQPVPQPVRKQRAALGLAVAVILIVAAGAIALRGGFGPISSAIVTVAPTASAITLTSTPIASITLTVTPSPSKLISHVMEIDLHRAFLPVLTRGDKPQRLTNSQVRATATAQTKATAAQAVQVTLTAQARDQWRAAIETRLDKVYGPGSDQLEHQPTDGAITLQAAGIDQRDAVIEATFVNPYASADGAWSYGFFFRQSGPNEAYQLIVRSDGGWRLIDRADTQAHLISWGNVSNLRIKATDSNTVKVLARGERGQLLVNGVFVAELNLSARAKPGDVSIATGFYAGDEQPVAMTRYSNFTVWMLK